MNKSQMKSEKNEVEVINWWISLKSHGIQRLLNHDKLKILVVSRVPNGNPKWLWEYVDVDERWKLLSFDVSLNFIFNI